MFLRRGWFIFCMAVILLLCTGVSVGASEQQGTEAAIEHTQLRKKGLIVENRHYRYYKNGQAVKNKWIKLKGYKYYFLKNGNAAIGSVKIQGKYYIFNTKGQLLTPKTDSVVKVASKYYYVTHNGTTAPGWKILSGKLYYVYKNGQCAAGEKKDGITFTKKAYAQKDTESTLKIKVMTIIDQITTSKMTQKQKLDACWNWCNNFHFAVWKFPDFTHKNWTREIALDMINTRSGNCYGLSSTFAAFAKELGYSPLLVDTGTHCWNEINGITYDGMFPNKHYSANTHPRRGIVKKKIKY